MQQIKLNKKQLLEVTGGAITASFINALSRGISTFLDLGRSIGSAIRRAVTGKICSL